MNKLEQIALKKIKPIEVGDYVKIVVFYTKEITEKVKVGRKNEWVKKPVNETFETKGTVRKIVDDKLHVGLSSVSIPYELRDILPTHYEERHSQYTIVDANYVKPTYYECGSNPFCKEKRRISFYNQDISSILLKAGYGRRSDDFKKQDDDRDWNRVNFNPFVIDANGQRQYYQRDLVWTLEQKQLLIESIYNDIEIGKFLFRYNAWGRMEKEKEETGVGHSFDCVDGKQRFFAILHFVQNKYPDNRGNYWDDLCANAHRRFLNYGNLSYGELPESATDEDVIDNFLTLNFTGVPMSKDHIEYVKSFNMK